MRSQVRNSESEVIVSDFHFGVVYKYIKSRLGL